MLKGENKILNLKGGKELSRTLTQQMKNYVDSRTASDLSAADSITYNNNVLTLKSGDTVLDSVVIARAEFVDPDEGTGDADLVLTDEEITYIFENAEDYEYDLDEADSDMLINESDSEEIFAVGLANNS